MNSESPRQNDPSPTKSDPAGLRYTDAFERRMLRRRRLVGGFGSIGLGLVGCIPSGILLFGSDSFRGSIESNDGPRLVTGIFGGGLILILVGIFQLITGYEHNPFP